MSFIFYPGPKIFWETHRSGFASFLDKNSIEYTVVSVEKPSFSKGSFVRWIGVVFYVAKSFLQFALHLRYFKKRRHVFISPLNILLASLVSICFKRRYCFWVSGLGFFNNNSFLRGLWFVVVVGCLRFTRFFGSELSFIAQNARDFQCLDSRFPGSVFLIKGNGVAGGVLTKRHPIAEGGRLHLVCVARLLKSKGVSDFCTFVSLLRSRGFEVDARWIGGVDSFNPERLEIQWVRELFDTHNVSWSGQLDESQVIEGVEAADFACLFSSSEGCSKFILDALVRGIPCICWDVTGLKDCVRDGVDGIVASRGDFDTLIVKFLHRFKSFNPVEIQSYSVKSYLGSEVHPKLLAILN